MVSWRGGGGDRDKCKHAGFILWTETRHEHFCDACLDVLSEGLRVIRVLLKQKRLQCSRMHTHTHTHKITACEILLFGFSLAALLFQPVMKTM